MKKQEIETKCPCGEPIKAMMQKPNRLRPTVTKLHCLKCQSKFMLKCSKLANEQYKIDFEELHIAEKAKKGVSGVKGAVKKMKNTLKTLQEL